jgi:hypothetical protein
MNGNAVEHQSKQHGWRSLIPHADDISRGTASAFFVALATNLCQPFDMIHGHAQSSSSARSCEEEANA